MSRTPNRYKRNIREQENKDVKEYLYVGKYLRLSVDSDYTGSDSIENQRKIINQYLKNFSNIKYEAEYVDNGISGTRFERPAFERLMQDMRDRIINCIIVKDLSRFGREHLEVGNYIEKIFPFMHIRFISINDNYDSFDSNCEKELLSLSLKNLMHEMYAKDISKKVSSAYKVKQKRHEFYRSSTVPYGYVYDDIKKSYVIDTETANIVREIFIKYSQGASKYSICQYLMKKNIATPKQYSAIICETQEVKKSEFKPWYISTIDRILRNEVYIGIANRHKTETEHFRDAKCVKVPEEEWIKIQNASEPIIESELFFKVQKLLNETKERYTDNDNMHKHIQKLDYWEHNALKGKIFCGDCGKVMIRITAYKQSNKKIYSYKVFKCSTCVHLPKLCTPKIVEEKKLYKLLQNIICTHIMLINNWKQVIEKNIKYSFEFKLNQIKENRFKLNKLKLNIQQEYLNIYDKYSENKITYNDFLNGRNIYINTINSYKKADEKLNQRQNNVIKYQRAFKNLVFLWLSYNENEKLNEEMIRVLIERIDVYKDNRIEVKLKYADCFLLLKEYLANQEEI